jgi:solute:Na+ symporter, SSS family
MGLFRLAVDTPIKLNPDFAYTEGSFLWVVNNIFFQYYSLLITIVCIIVNIAVSYAGKAPDYQKISGLTFATMTPEDRKATRDSWSMKDVITSILLLAAIIGAYLYFTG